MAPSKMKAAVTIGEKGRVAVKEIDVPKPGPGELLVKIVASAANPTDWKTVTRIATSGNVVGCDYAGTIEEFGAEVPEAFRKVGTRVAGFIHGGAYPNGAQAEYGVASAATAILIPDSWTLEQASQLPVAAFTACMTLYYVQSLPTPLSPATEEPRTDILVWGGSSSVGQFVVQLAHRGNLRVIATASPHNFDLVKSLGADVVLSHSDPDTPSKIRELTGRKLKHAVDTISEGSTPAQVAECMGDEGGTVSTTLRYESPRKDVEVKFVLGYMLLGKATEIPYKLPADPAQHEFAKKASDLLSKALAKDLLKPGPIRILPKGLESVNEGFDLLRNGKVSGEKIVYRIADTP